MKHIKTKEGLNELLKRYKEAGITDESYSDRWISVITYCLTENLAMDEIDYANTPKDLRKLWEGLK